MYETSYHRATSVEEARRIAETCTDPRYLAGGMTLLPSMKQRLIAPSDLIDLRRVEALIGIEEQGGAIRIGASTCHEAIASSALLRERLPGLVYMARHIGDPMVRHMGTMGGAIANNDPAACYPAALLALGAMVETDRRTIAADDFFTGLFETALDDDEIITAIRIAPARRTGYGKFPNPASRYALSGVFVAEGDFGIRVAVTGAGKNGVFRAFALERALAADFSPHAIDGLMIDAEQLMGDLHASAEYRAALVNAMAKRAVQIAVESDKKRPAPTRASRARRKR